MQIKPLGDRILIEKVEAEEKTAGGIVLPTSAQEQPSIANVIAISEEIQNDEKKKDLLHVGDKVIFSKFSGTEDDAEVKDTVISGFGVIDNKAYDDTATYKDLLYNLSYLFYENMNENTDEMIKRFKDLKIFDKETLDAPVSRETLAKALVLKKLSLKPEDIRTDVFNEDIKAKEKAYPALMIMLSGDFKDMDFEENATVHEMLKMISSIIFR